MPLREVPLRKVPLREVPLLMAFMGAPQVSAGAG
jgi:hypothetical protein